MTRKQTKTNAYPTVKPLNDIYVNDTSGVTLVGPDKQVWQMPMPRGMPHLTSTDASNMPLTAPPGVDPKDYVNKFLIGPGGKVLTADVVHGQYGWREEKNPSANSTVGFKLPTGEEMPTTMEPGVIDDRGTALTLFNGASASYRRSDALPVYWDGECFFDTTKTELYVPDSFKRGIPSTYGLTGCIYIPQESYLADLLIPISEQQQSWPPEYHSPTDFAKIGVLPNGRHQKTGRKVGHQDAKDCFESAWDAAVFEVEDIFTMKNAPFRQRREILETFIKPLKDAYKQIRLIPAMRMHSPEIAMSAYENTPPNAYLVFTDPEGLYVGAVDPTERAPPRKRIIANETNNFSGPVLAWDIDASASLRHLIVRGNSVGREAVLVREGQLWVKDGVTWADQSDVENQKKDEIAALKKLRDSDGIRLPNEFVDKLIKSYTEDFDKQTRSRKAIDEPVSVHRTRASRYIRNVIGNKLWNIGEDKARVESFGGASIKKEWMTKMVDYAMSGVLGKGKTIFDGAVFAEFVKQLGFFVKTVADADLAGTEAFPITAAQIKPTDTDRDNYVWNIYNAMTPQEKKAFANGLRTTMSMQERAKAVTMASSHAAAVYDATKTDRNFAIGTMVTEKMVMAFLHTDQDPAFPLEEDRQLFKIHGVKGEYKRNNATSALLEFDKNSGSGTEAVTEDIVTAFRTFALAVIGRLLQSVKVGPLFPFYSPMGKPAVKNVLKWDRYTRLNYVRSYPAGTNIEYKVVPGDVIDENTKEDDTYMITQGRVFGR
jgi:hypothetical protein